MGMERGGRRGRRGGGGEGGGVGGVGEEGREEGLEVWGREGNEKRRKGLGEARMGGRKYGGSGRGKVGRKRSGRMGREWKGCKIIVRGEESVQCQELYMAPKSTKLRNTTTVPHVLNGQPQCG